MLRSYFHVILCGLISISITLTPYKTYAHGGSEISQAEALAAAESVSDSFVIDSDHLDAQFQKVNHRVHVMLEKLNGLHSKKGVIERPYQFLSQDQLTRTQKNAAADILLETMAISFDYVEHGLTCVDCKNHDVVPKTYREMMTSQINEIKNFMSHTEGDSFERLETVINYMIVRYQIRRNEVLSSLGHFLKGVGVKISGDLAEIYGERGSVALTLVFLTWIPYTAVSEVVEHSIIGPFAVFCMTSQLLYFAVIKSVFDFFTNAKNLLVYSLFSKTSDILVTDFIRLLVFQARTKFRFGLALSHNSKYVLTRKKLKKALHIDFMSRLHNIQFGFMNFAQKKAYQLGLKSYYNPYELHKIKIDAFLYSVLKTPNWADLAAIELAHNGGPEVINYEDAVASPKDLESTLVTLVSQNKGFEAFLIFKEMYLVLDILRKQMASSLRVMKESEYLTLSEYLVLKTELGRIYSTVQKTRFASLLVASRATISSDDIRILMISYDSMVRVIKRFYSISQEPSEERSSLRSVSGSSRSWIQKMSFGQVSTCNAYFSL